MEQGDSARPLPRGREGESGYSLESKERERERVVTARRVELAV